MLSRCRGITFPLRVTSKNYIPNPLRVRPIHSTLCRAKNDRGINENGTYKSRPLLSAALLRNASDEFEDFDTDIILKDGKGEDLQGRRKEVFERYGRAPSRTLYVKNMPYEVKMEEVEQVFADFNIEKIRLQRGPDGRTPGYCHVDFKTVESAADALLEEEAYDLMLGGRKLTMEPSSTPSVSSDGLTPTKNLYLTEFTEALPNPVAVAALLPKDLQARTNVSRCFERADGSFFGWLDFLIPEDATRAKDVITRYLEENPGPGVLCRYKRSDRQTQGRVFSEYGDPLYTGKRRREGIQDTKGGQTWMAGTGMEHI